MRKTSNKEEIIRLSRDAFVRITDTQFEYSYGVVSENHFAIPVDSIIEAYILNNTDSNPVGCNILFDAIKYLFSTPDNFANVDGHPERPAIKLIISYKIDSDTERKYKRISWPGLTEKKAQRIIKIIGQ